MDRHISAHTDPRFWMRVGVSGIATFIAGSLCAIVVIQLGGWTHGLIWEVDLLARGEYTGSSYPSGHAMAVTRVIGILVVLLYRERGAVWPLLAWILLLIATCYSRLYVGVHWPTDVVGGLLAGGVWFVGLLWVKIAQATSATSSEVVIPPRSRKS